MAWLGVGLGLGLGSVLGMFECMIYR